MRAWTAGMAAALALSPASAGAQEAERAQRLFCRDLKQVVAAAEDDPPFYGLERGVAAPPTLGFRPGCQVSGGGARRAWFCHQTLAPPELSLAALAQRTAACLPEAKPLPASRGEALFALPGLRIRISERGAPRAHVGRIVSYAVETR